MRTSTGKPTKAQERRFRQLQDMGCIVCSLFFGAYRAPDIHHILSGGRRRGHDFTLPLCPEHHRLPTGYYGPSLAGGTRAFEKAWGSQESLLAKVNEALIPECLCKQGECCGGGGEYHRCKVGA